LTAKEELRLNEQDHRVAETEADMWHQVLHIDDQLASERLDAETKRRLEANRGRVIMGLGQRTKSLLTMPEYVKVITQILTMPGMHSEFVSKNFEVFSKERTIEV
jgi:hypothetical protein